MILVSNVLETALTATLIFNDSDPKGLIKCTWIACLEKKMVVLPLHQLSGTKWDFQAQCVVTALTDAQL